jgi:hypothetical protein
VLEITIAALPEQVRRGRRLEITEGASAKNSPTHSPRMK